MAHFAEIDNNNIVLRVLVCDSIEWLQQNLGGNWIETGEGIRKNFAGIGYTYDQTRDAFIPQRPIPKEGEIITLNENTCIWESNLNIDATKL